MPVDLSIVESTTELGQTVVEVVLDSSSTPGVAGPGVPTGGTLNQVLTKDSVTDYDTSWQDAQGAGGGAPDDATYLVTAAHGDLSAEVVVGAAPGGELGGTWSSPTVDATHSGSSHAAAQAAAEATAAAALSSHEGDTTSVHGIADTSVLATDSEVATAVSDHSADTTAVHGIADTAVLALTANHPSNASFNDHSARHEDGGADEISIAGLAGTPTDLQTHLDDAADAHDATAISFAPDGSISATTVQAAIVEVRDEAGAGGVPSLEYETRSSNTILGVADKGKTIDITATITQTFEADETLSDGWWVILRNATDEGTVIVTLNPAGTETIDGLTTVTMYSGESRLIYCNGAAGNFNSILLSGGFARFTTDQNFIVPHGITQVVAECIGSGGGGGGGRGAAAGGVRQGGSAGGGGSRVYRLFAASLLGNPGDTITVDIGAGGASGAGGSTANGSTGTVGSNTTFGSFLTGYGGGAGAGGSSTNDRVGAGGGGDGEAGAAGGGAVATRGGGNFTAGAAGMGGSGGGGTAAGAAGTPSEYGGGAGGGSAAAGGAGSGGGTSTHGAGGGGGGGGLTTGNAESTGGAGGDAGLFTTTGGGGGTGGAVNGGAGGLGADGNLRICGDGGGGGGSQDSGTGGAGNNGGTPGGGAGGGGGGTTVGGAGGVGGAGECRVWYS